MTYKMQKEDALSFAAHIGAETKEQGDELWFRHCPKCEGTTSDEWKFSINLESGAFKCFRGSCDYHGHFVELAREYDFPLTDGSEVQTYRQLHVPKHINEPKNEVFEYFKKRGISERVVRQYQISLDPARPNLLYIPFFNQTGKLEFVKYRDMLYDKNSEKHKTKEFPEEGTRPILFGMNHCHGFDRCIITEGQIDALSLVEAGFENVLSVPMGCTNFAWFPNCYEWLSQFSEIIVFGDREKGKITLIDDILDRLGTKLTVRCIQSADYLFEKDANDILTRHGPEWLKKAVENAKVPDISSVKPLSDVSIVDLNELEKIPTGLPKVDEAIGGLVLGTVTLISGRSGEGKSTFMSQIICSALESGRKFFAYSGELLPYHFRSWLDMQLATDKYIVTMETKEGRPYGKLPKDVAERIGSWYRGRAYIYDNESELDRSSVLQTVEKAIKLYGVQLVCIDNLMTAMETLSASDDLYRAQGDFVKRLKEIAKHYHVAVCLIAHPKKTNDRNWNNDNISGASEVGNYVDVIMSYSRDKEPNTAKLEIGKNRITGRLCMGDQAIPLRYSALSKRIYDTTQHHLFDYGWTRTENTSAETFAPVDPDDDLPF